MRIHTSAAVTLSDVYAAAKKARAGITVSEHRSRTHDHAFEVKLTGLSRRRPNGGNYGAGDDYAATWDQWGVFLGALYDVDYTVKSWAYADGGEFDYKTNGRFENLGKSIPFPLDHDHRFEYAAPFTFDCTKCGARQRSSY